MATTVTYSHPLQSHAVDLGASGVIVLLSLPARFTRVRIKFWHTNDTAADTGKMSHTGTEGAAMGSDAWHVGSDGEDFTLPGAQVTTLRLCGTTANGRAHLLLMER